MTKKTLTFNLRFNIMKFKRLQKILVLFTIILFTSCNKTDSSNDELTVEEIVEPYFTLDVKQTWFTGSTDDWIVVHNANGQLLNYESYESGKIIAFQEGDIRATDELYVTIISKRESIGKTIFDIITYQQVPKGVIWKQLQQNTIANFGNRNPLQREVPLKIENIPEPIRLYSISDKFGFLETNPSFENENTITAINGTLGVHGNNQGYVISILDGNKELKYFFIDDLQNTSNITLDYSEFNYFDKYIEVEMPEDGFSFRAKLTGLNGEDFVNYNGYDILQVSFGEFDTSTINPFKIGILDRFDNYMTNFMFDKGYGGFKYESLNFGDAPNKIEMPKEPNLNILNNSMEGFDFTTNFDYKIKQNWWGISNETKILTWGFYSGPSVPQKALDLPVEIIGNFKTTDFQYRSSDFYLDKSYQTFLEEEPTIFKFNISKSMLTIPNSN